MKNSNSVSSKTQTEVSKFHEWLEKIGNIHLSNLQAMDRAYNIVQEKHRRATEFEKARKYKACQVLTKF